MRKGQIKKAFTLIEIVIVLVITAILIGILFKVYTTTADIAMRVKYQKQLGMSLVTTQTIIQNITDTHTVDYEALSGSTWDSTPGWTKTLPLQSVDNKKAVLTITAS
jgi:prepilin-type N-terminal cleavage/methylation domain-containing protein